MRYVFMGWSGDYTGTGMNGTLTMDAAKTVTANYQPQYFVSVSQQPSNAPTPQGGGWFNEGATASISVPSQNASLNSGAQFVFTGWTVDGNSQAGPTLSLQMNAPHTVVAQYKQQYYLTVQSEQGSVPGSGWYDAGSNVPITASTPPSQMFGVNYVFNGWQGSTQSSSQSTTVLMNGPMTVTATWRTDYTVLYVTLGAIIAIIAVAAFAIIRTKKKSKQTQ
jgi:Divergent InlB B-repeat domain